MGYFFAALSTRKNLEMCKKFALAGFPETWSGVWAYVDIQLGDFVSFLYGGRAYDLYKVVKKEALEKAETLPPSWEPIPSRRGDIYFPYRLYLKPIREFDEILARPEFLYIAENLLRRGGIRKSHFQADLTTLFNVSKMGEISCTEPEVLLPPQYTTFTPYFVRRREDAKPPKINQLREEFIHSILRLHLAEQTILKSFLKELGVEEPIGKWEVLGERALERGYVDLLIKEAEPRGEMKQIVVEVKSGVAIEKDVRQLLSYVEEIGKECIGGAVIAEGISKKVIQHSSRNIHCWGYTFENIDLDELHTFEELLSEIRIFKIA